MRNARFKRLDAVSGAGVALVSGGVTANAGTGAASASRLDFVTHSATSIQFAFQSDGHTVPATKIIIGAGQVHPAGDPFTITRVPPPTTITAAATTTAATTTT